MSSSTTGSTIYRTLPRWCLSTMSKLCLCLWCSWCFSTLSELGSACGCGGCGARGACLLCPIRGVVRLSGTFWLVLSSFFRWQVPSVNLPKLGLDCPPDSTRLHQTSYQTPPNCSPDSPRFLTRSEVASGYCKSCFHNNLIQILSQVSLFSQCNVVFSLSKLAHTM